MNGEFVTDSNIEITPSSLLDAYRRADAARPKSDPKTDKERRLVDWRFAVMASLGLWALIIGIGAILLYYA